MLQKVLWVPVVGCASGVSVGYSCITFAADDSRLRASWKLICHESIFLYSRSVFHLKLPIQEPLILGLVYLLNRKILLLMQYKAQ